MFLIKMFIYNKMKRKSKNLKVKKLKSKKLKNDGTKKIIMDKIIEKYQNIINNLYKIIEQRIINILSIEREERHFIPFTDEQIMDFITEYNEEIWNMIANMVEEYGIGKFKDPESNLINYYLYQYLPLPTYIN